MKTKNIMIYATIIVNFLACTKQNEPIKVYNNKPQDSIPVEIKQDERDMTWLNVIKFTNEEYKDYILAYDNDVSKTIDTTNCFITCGISINDLRDIEHDVNRCNIYGKNPYIDLGNGFLLIDWKWAHIFGEFQGSLLGALNKEYAILLNHTWDEYSSIYQIWNKNETIAHYGCIDTLYHFKVITIDEYRGEPFIDRDFTKHPWYMAYIMCYGFLDHDITDEEINKIDSIQSIYAQYLTDILKNHKFDSNFAFIDSIK